MANILGPDEILDKVSDAYVKKARANTKRLFILSFLAGAFIAFAAAGSRFCIF